MPLAQIAGIGYGLEACFVLQITEEPTQQLSAFLAGFVGHGFLQGGVLRVEEFEQNFQDMQGLGFTGSVALQDGLWCLIDPRGPANGLVLDQAAGADKMLVAAARHSALW